MWERRTGRLLGRFARDVELPKNLLLNGDFQIWQRGAGPFTSVSAVVNNDDAYLADQWVFLANGSDTCDVSQETSVIPTGGIAAIKLDVETANRKFGIFQPIENIRCRSVLGQTVSLSFAARITGTSISNLRAAVISWDSTVDTVTSDVVSAWNAAGTDPTLVANWTYENTPINLAVTTSYQTFTIENVAIDTTNAVNVGVFIWVDDTDAVVADFVYIADASLVSGTTSATTFIHPEFSDEISRCQRYAWVIGFPSTTSPTQIYGVGRATSATEGDILLCLPITMRTSSTSVTLSSNAHWTLGDTSGDAAISLFNGGHIQANCAWISAAVAAGLGADEAIVLRAASTSAFMIFSVEL